MADTEKPSDEVDAVAGNAGMWNQRAFRMDTADLCSLFGAARSETDKEPAADPSANNAATADPTTNSSANTSTVSLPKLVPIAADSYVKLFVGQLPGVCDSDELKTAFLAQGQVLELAVLRDKRTGKPQGAASSRSCVARCIGVADLSAQDVHSSSTRRAQRLKLRYER